MSGESCCRTGSKRAAPAERCVSGAAQCPRSCVRYFPVLQNVPFGTAPCPDRPQTLTPHVICSWRTQAGTQISMYIFGVLSQRPATATTSAFSHSNLGLLSVRGPRALRSATSSSPSTPRARAARTPRGAASPPPGLLRVEEYIVSGFHIIVNFTQCCAAGSFFVLFTPVTVIDSLGRPWQCAE